MIIILIYLCGHIKTHLFAFKQTVSDFFALFRYIGQREETMFRYTTILTKVMLGFYISAYLY